MLPNNSFTFIISYNASGTFCVSHLSTHHTECLAAALLENILSSESYWIVKIHFLLQIIRLFIYIKENHGIQTAFQFLSNVSVFLCFVHIFLHIINNYTWKLHLVQLSVFSCLSVGGPLFHFYCTIVCDQ